MAINGLTGAGDGKPVGRASGPDRAAKTPDHRLPEAALLPFNADAFLSSENLKILQVYVERVARGAEVRPEVVAAARKALENGELDRPEAFERAANAILSSDDLGLEHAPPPPPDAPKPAK
jgi:hypothetical protein